MNTVKPGALFMMSIMALAVVGAGYAHWSDSININGVIYMGDLVFGFYNESEYEIVVEETTNGFPEDEQGHNFEPKPWVANTKVVLSNNETGAHHVPPQEVWKNMTVIVDNAYPQYDVHIDAYLKNAGTVPVHICPDFALDFKDETDGEPLEFEIEDQGFNGSAHWMKGNITDWGDDNTWGTADDFVIMKFEFTLWIANIDLQVHPCEENLSEIDISFTQEAEECHTYTFEVKMLAIQWNKDYECDDILP